MGEEALALTALVFVCLEVAVTLWLIYVLREGFFMAKKKKKKTRKGY